MLGQFLASDVSIIITKNFYGQFLAGDVTCDINAWAIPC